MCLYLLLFNAMLKYHTICYHFYDDEGVKIFFCIWDTLFMEMVERILLLHLKSEMDG